jgi:1-acyl-sn-glycerol-3-phosphate acyltransferase
MAEQFAQRPQLLLGLAPEGTRSKVSKWRTGFYHIATAANLPILPVALDFGRREVRVEPLFHPTGDLEADIAFLQHIFQDAQGYNPELGVWD